MKKIINMYMLIIALAATTQLQAGWGQKVYAADDNGRVASEIVAGGPSEGRQGGMEGQGSGGTGQKAYTTDDDGTVASEVEAGGPSEGMQGGIEGQGSGGTGQKETSDK